MRVISGIRKGHKLKVVKGKSVRPTEDKVKESLFNILGPIDETSLVLDLFAGTGSIGIEFLSRGAKEAYFVDRSYESINVIKENLQHTKLMGKSQVIKGDSVSKLEYFQKLNIEFDYIYIDPPYNDSKIIIKALESINNKTILSVDGMIILEHDKDLDISKWDIDFKLVDQRVYGTKIISFLKEN